MMTSNATQIAFPVTDTPSSLTISTSLGKVSHHNVSDSGNEIPNTNASSPERVPFDIDEYSYSSVLIFITVMGTLGNILLFMMMRDKKVNFLSYSVYLKYLAVSDSVLLITRLIREIQRILSLRRIILINNVLCKTFYSARLVVMLLSPWLVVGLTLDRYVCVCFPLTRDRLCTKNKARIVCLTMLTVSVLLTIPFLVTLEIADDICRPDQVRYYFVVFRLILSSTLPCILILVLNILMVVQIKRSYTFRNMFSRTTGSTNHQQDSATRPLVLVSVLAFVTLLPLTVSEVVLVYLQTFTGDVNSFLLTTNIWRILFMIYVLNFGQNFYILMASSPTYRDIAKRMLSCCSFRWNKRNQGELPTLTSNPRPISASGSGTIGLSVPTISSGNTGPALESSESKSTDLSITM